MTKNLGTITQLGQELETDKFLATPAASAGFREGSEVLGKGAQRRLRTEQREAEIKKLHRDIAALEATDRRRQTFNNLDKFSTQFVASHPSTDNLIGNYDFYQVVADYFGVPCANIAQYVGKRIGKARGGTVIDKYGDALTTTALPGGGWTTNHDSAKWALFHLASTYAQMPISCEVLGLFATSLNQEHVKNLSNSERQGLVPDFRLGDTLMELKRFYMSPLFFNPLTLQSRCGAVAKRAAEVHPDYVKKCKLKDREINNTPEGVMGPMMTKLMSYGRVKGLVVGPHGEGSADLHEFVESIISAATQKRWKTMGAENSAHARPVISNFIYKFLGITFVRAQARLKRHAIAVSFGECSESSSAERKELARNSWYRARSEYANSFGGDFYMFPEQ